MFLLKKCTLLNVIKPFTGTFTFIAIDENKKAIKIL